MPLLEMKHITKSFAGVYANEDVDLSVEQGEIHALLGENGAGKTTLMNILFGIYQADKGEICFKGEHVEFKSPGEAIARGIGMVHQHFSLVKKMTVLDNVMLGLKGQGIVADRKSAREKLTGLAATYGLLVNPEAPVHTLSVGEQQRVEILTAIYQGADILILDEPTAVLTPQETEVLFETLRHMKEDGKSIILITHKLEEIISIVDEVTVLRDGKLIGTRLAGPDMTKEELTRMMVGRDVLFNFTEPERSPGEVRLCLEGVCARNDKDYPALTDFSLELREGEVVGLAGVDGNGQKELCEVITGLRTADKGVLKMDGESITNRPPVFYIRKGIAHIPEDRHTTGLALKWSLKKNLVLKAFGREPFSRHGFISEKTIDAFWDKARAEYQIKASSGDEQARSLSGGNQQKVILARELSEHPRVVVANQPTRGLDIGASEYVRQKLLDARNEGCAVLLVSADLEEILQLSDRIAVIYDGRLMGVLPRGASVDEIGSLMMGKQKEAHEHGK